MIATLERIEDVADHTRTFWFRPEQRMHYVAGQFTELYLPHNNADDRGERRWFTLSSSPTEELLAITTRFTRGRSSTFKQVLRELSVGAQISLADPMGDFVLPKDRSIPLLFAAAGMGITPVRSMIRFLLDSGERRDITVLYAVPTQRHLAFQAVFETYKKTYGLGFQPIVREADESWQGQIGSLISEHIVTALNGKLKTQVYLSGPETLAKKLAAEVKAQGVAAYRIVTDLFPGYSHE